MVQVEIEIPAVHIVLANQLGFIGLVNRRLQTFTLADEFSADVDVTGVSAHGEPGDQAPFHEQVRIMPHDLAVLARSRLGLVGIHDQVMRAPVRFLRHERPLQAGRKSCAAAPAQAGGLHLFDDRIAAFFENGLGAIPGAASTRALETPVVLAVKIFEDSILVSQHRSRLFPERRGAADRRR